MYLLADPDTYWLNVTNVILGAATVLFLIILVRTAIRDLRER
jgi:hypothetical protein